jgi:hypothetical protein
VSAAKVIDTGHYAFANCAALETADFSLATSIGVFAFYGCTALKTANLPAVTSIGRQAFRDCKALTSLTLPEDTPEELGEAVFENTYGDGNSDPKLYIHVGSESAAEAYEKDGTFPSALANPDQDPGDKYGKNHKQIDITP